MARFNLIPHVADTKQPAVGLADGLVAWLTDSAHASMSVSHAQLVPVGIPPAEVPFGVALLNLIPQVVDTEQPAFGLADGVDANGYAIPARGADWDWMDWHSAVAFHTDGVLQIGTLILADPGRAPAPICILTDTPVLAGG